MKSKERRQLTQAWRRDYDQYRPHSVLVYVTPAEFTATCPGGLPGETRYTAVLRPTAALQQYSGTSPDFS